MTAWEFTIAQRGSIEPALRFVRGAAPSHSKTFNLPATQMPLRKAVRTVGRNNEHGEVGHRVSQSRLVPCNQPRRKRHALLWGKQAGAAGPGAWCRGERGAPVPLSPTEGPEGTCTWPARPAGARTSGQAPRRALRQREAWPPVGLCAAGCRGCAGVGTVPGGDDVWAAMGKAAAQGKGRSEGRG